MNIFKEMAFSIYNYGSYKEFLKNKKSKVFGFGMLLMLFYFLITMIIPVAKTQIIEGSFAYQFSENIPEFELSDGELWVDGVFEYEGGGSYIYIDTDPQYFLYGADRMKEYLYGYTQAVLMDSEKIIVKSEGQVQELYFSDLDFTFSKDDLMKLVPFMYLLLVALMIIAFVWMSALFFFGVLFVALLGMIVASCMKYQLTFGQLYLLGIYSRTLPLIIKALLSLFNINIPFFFIINFGISVLIIGLAINKMKENQIIDQAGGNQNNNDLTWMK